MTEISSSIEKIEQEVQQLTKQIVDFNEENEELRQTFKKSCKDFESFKQSNNFRLNLVTSKEN